MTTRILTVAAIAMLMSQQAQAADVKLQHKYPEGTKTTSQTESSTHQILTIAGMDLETSNESFVVTESAIGKREADGTLRVESTVKRFQTQLSLPGGINVAFDSDNPDKQPDNPQLAPLFDVYRAVLKSNTILVLDKDNKIKAVEMPNSPQDAVGEMFKSQFGPENQKRTHEQGLQILPDSAVAVGDSWTRTNEVDFGAGQLMTFTTQYEYLGTKDVDGKLLHQIKPKPIAVEYAQDPNSPSPLKVTESNLKVTESDGLILFDEARGQTVKNRSKLRIQGEMSFEINGQKLPGKIDLTIESNVASRPATE